MNLIIRALTGQVLTVDVEASTLISDVKDRIAKQQGNTSGTNLRLAFAGKQLENDRTLADYNIQEGTTLYVS